METQQPTSTTPRTASDIMTGPVRSVLPESSVADLVRLFRAEHISGAAVVSAAGELVGVVSVSDVIRLLCDGREVPVGDPLLLAPAAAPRPGEPDPQEVLESFFVEPGDRLPPMQERGDESSLLADTDVAGIMTAATFTISASASVPEVADALVRGGIHRLLVLEAGQLKGIVTTVDVVRAVASEVQ